MELSKNDGRVLDGLLDSDGPVAQNELAERTGMYASNVTVHVRRLVEAGLVCVERRGKKKFARLQEGDVAGFLAARASVPQLKLSDIFVGKTPALLALVKKFGGKPFRTSSIPLPRLQASRLLRKLKSVGLVYTAGRGKSALRPGTQRIPWFCANFVTRVCLAEAKNEVASLTGITVDFESISPPKFIVTARYATKSKRFFPTAFSAAPEYGVQLIQAGKYYYSNAKPDAADVALHVLAVDSGPRGIACAAAILLKNERGIERLPEKGGHFGVPRGRLEDLVSYVKNHGSFVPNGFPPWEDVARLRE